MESIHSEYAEGEILYQNIQKLCESRKMTIAGLQNALGFPVSSISRWRTSSPTVRKLQRVADYFNVSLDFLLSPGYQNTPDPLDLQMLESLLQRTRSGKISWRCITSPDPGTEKLASLHISEQQQLQRIKEGVTSGFVFPHAEEENTQEELFVFEAAVNKRSIYLVRKGCASASEDMDPQWYYYYSLVIADQQAPVFLYRNLAVDTGLLLLQQTMPAGVEMARDFTPAGIMKSLYDTIRKELDADYASAEIHQFILDFLNQVP